MYLLYKTLNSLPGLRNIRQHLSSALGGHFNHPQKNYNAKSMTLNMEKDPVLQTELKGGSTRSSSKPQFFN